MYINSEIREAQLEQLASDPLTLVKGRIWSQPTAPIKIFDGTQTHKVLTDKMFPEIKAANFPSGVLVSDLTPGFLLPEANLVPLSNIKVVPNFTISPAANTSTTSITFSEISILTISVTASGSRPVEIAFFGGQIISWDNTAVDSTFSYFQIQRNDVQLGDIITVGQSINLNAYQLKTPTGTQGNRYHIPASVVRVLDTAPIAGVNTYKVLYRSEKTSIQTSLDNVRLMAREF